MGVVRGVVINWGVACGCGYYGPRNHFQKVETYDNDTPSCIIIIIPGTPLYCQENGGEGEGEF